MVIDYNPRTNHHTVHWDNAPTDQSGVTEVKHWTESRKTEPKTRYRIPETLSPDPRSLKLKTYTLDHEPQTLNPKPKTLNPRP